METRRARVRVREAVHYRPAVTVERIANVFEECRIVVITDRGEEDAKSIAGLVSAGLVNGQDIEVQADGRDEGIAVEVVRETLENLFLIPLDGDNEDFENGRKKLFDRVRVACSISGKPTQHDLLDRLRIKCGVDRATGVFQVQATINERGGMHVLPSSLLPTLKSDFSGTTVELLYVGKDGELASADLYDQYELMATGLPDQATVSVKARGTKAETAAKSVRNILENMATIIQRLGADGGGVAVSRSILTEYFAS